VAIGLPVTVGAEGVFGMKITVRMVRSAAWICLPGDRSIGDPVFRVPEGQIEVGGCSLGHVWWVRGNPTPRALQEARYRKARMMEENSKEELEV
jgi:hypothetical protein